VRFSDPCPELTDPRLQTFAEPAGSTTAPAIESQVTFPRSYLGWMVQLRAVRAVEDRAHARIGWLIDDGEKIVLKPVTTGPMNDT
jgi:hypothetical protein